MNKKNVCLQRNVLTIRRTEIIYHHIYFMGNNEQHVFLKVKSDFFYLLGRSEIILIKIYFRVFACFALRSFLFERIIYLMSSEIILFYASFSTPEDVNYNRLFWELDVLFVILAYVCVIRYLYSTQLTHRYIISELHCLK